MTDKKRKIFKWTLLILLLGYWVGMSVWARMEASRHLCTGIAIEITGPQTSMDSTIRAGINEELHAYPQRIVGTEMHKLNTADIERYITRLNTFESVNCFLSARGELVVRVMPLVPVMRVFSGGKSWYVNKEGRQIESNAEFYTDVPVVTGNFNSNFTPAGVLPVVRHISSDETLSALTGMIVARDAHNIMIIPRIRGQVINLGDTNRLAEKTHSLTMFYRQVMPYKGWNFYDTISVKYRGQIVATRRDKTLLNHSEQYEEEEDMEEGTLPSDDAQAPEPAKKEKKKTTA